jgi:hypothetical protein
MAFHKTNAGKKIAFGACWRRLSIANLPCTVGRYHFNGTRRSTPPRPSTGAHGLIMGFLLFQTEFLFLKAAVARPKEGKKLK